MLAAQPAKKYALGEYIRFDLSLTYIGHYKGICKTYPIAIDIN